MRKKTLSHKKLYRQTLTVLSSIFAVCCIVLPHSALAGYLHMDTVDEAIKLTKAAGDYGKASISQPNGNTTIIWFQSYEITQLEGDFKRLVDNYRTDAQKGNTGFTLALQTKDLEWQSKIYSGSIDVKERAKSIFNDRLYQSYINLRNNPSRQNSNTTTTTTTTITTSSTGTQTTSTITTNNNTRTFTKHSTYSTASGKTYTIWKSSDNRYRFNQYASNGFQNLTDLKNYLEYQNRIIYQAPNGRMYGIFKQNNRFYFNRDEGSISNLSRATLEDTKAYINQHNLALPECPRAKEWKCL